jgi:hypothetical protein
MLSKPSAAVNVAVGVPPGVVAVVEVGVVVVLVDAQPAREAATRRRARLKA